MSKPSSERGDYSPKSPRRLGEAGGNADILHELRQPPPGAAMSGAAASLCARTAHTHPFPHYRLASRVPKWLAWLVKKLLVQVPEQQTVKPAYQWEDYSDWWNWYVVQVGEAGGHDTRGHANAIVSAAWEASRRRAETHP